MAVLNGASRGPLPSDRPARVVVVGAGGMGRWWVETVVACPEAELVGVADLDDGVARAAIDGSGAVDPAAIPSAADGVRLALDTEADLLVDATIPSVHHPLTVRALGAGIPVLGEKPVTETLAQALSLVAHAEATGTPFMVSQSRRFFPQVRLLRSFTATHGPPVLTSAFFSMYGRAEGYRRAEPHPVLRDIGIHTVDAARYVLGAEPVAVTAFETRPDSSTYDHPATASCTFEMDDGSLFVSQGSWDIRGLTTGWNAEWRIGLQHGSATWDGTGMPVLGTEDGAPDPQVPLSFPDEPDQIAASLREFVAALRESRTPLCEVHDNVMSLAMIEAASLSADTGRRVVLDDLLEEARTEALDSEMDDAARHRLTAWPTVREALRRP